MPVKVKCQSCEKVFAAPDAARGKAVKCPGCQERVKVPAGGGAKSGGAPAQKKPVKKAGDDDHEDILKNLDLDGAEDEHAKVCPKCGQEYYEEDAIECASCGLNFGTGLTKDKQKGVDPKIFFRVVWKDSWAFLQKNRSFAIRTSSYTVGYSLLFLFFAFMVGWCSSFPPRLFWMGLTVIFSMVPSGWVWFLNGEVIKATLDKREEMPRTNFDMFTSVSLGIKFFAWHIAMGVQLILPAVGPYLIWSGQLIPGIVVTALGELLLFLTVPQVMVHMAMPVKTRGWLAHVQFQAFGKSFTGCAYWCMLTFVVMLPVLVPAGLMCGIGHSGLTAFLNTELENARANTVRGNDQAAVRAAINNPKKGEALPVFDEKDPRYENKPLPWKGIIVPMIGLIISGGMFGFSAVFAMRANGLLALYFKKLMKLDTMAREVVWVNKEAIKQARLDNETPAERKARQRKEQVVNALAVVVFLAVVGGIGWYIYKENFASNSGQAPADGGGQPPVEGGAAPGGGAMPGGAAMPGGQVPVVPGGAAAAGGVVIP